MAPKAEGIWPCTVLGATYGEDDRHLLVVRINAKITDGPDKGKMCTYEDQVNTRSAIYIARSCKAVGWAGKTLTTLAADCQAWIEKTGGASTVEIRHLEIKNGKRAGEIWDKVNSIGRGPKPIAPPSRDVMADAEEAMRKALAEDGNADEPPPDEAPHAASADSDIPF